MASMRSRMRLSAGRGETEVHTRSPHAREATHASESWRTLSMASRTSTHFTALCSNSEVTLARCSLNAAVLSSSRMVSLRSSRSCGAAGSWEVAAQPTGGNRSNAAAVTHNFLLRLVLVQAPRPIDLQRAQSCSERILGHGQERNGGVGATSRWALSHSLHMLASRAVPGPSSHRPGSSVGPMTKPRNRG